MSELDAYTDAKHPLTKKGQLAIGRIIQDFPALNTVEDVERLVDIVSYYGLSSMGELRRYLNEYGSLFTHLAVSYLFEGAGLDRGDNTEIFKTRFEKRPMVHTTMLLDLIELASTFIAIETVEDVDDLITKMGGLDDAIDLSHDAVELILMAEDSFAEDDEDDDSNTSAN
jgi:hypothetical protein